VELSFRSDSGGEYPTGPVRGEKGWKRGTGFYTRGDNAQLGSSNPGRGLSLVTGGSSEKTLGPDVATPIIIHNRTSDEGCQALKKEGKGGNPQKKRRFQKPTQT